MNCVEKISSQEYVDILVRTRDNTDEWPNKDVCFLRIDKNWSVMYLDINAIPRLDYGTYGYYAIPKLFGLMDVKSMSEAGILKVQNQSALGLKGNGVIIGIMDTGIDYLHEAFLDELGNTRILSIWDQTAAGVLDEELYGAFYDREIINDAVHSDNPYSYVPQTDEIGHGTFLAGIAAGSCCIEGFSGAAPLSYIISVKLRQCKNTLKNFHKISQNAVCYSESDIMLAVKYLNQKAKELNMPLVILCGLGSSMGSHTIGGVLSRYISQAAENANTAVITAVGNEGGFKHHYSGQIDVSKTYDTAEIFVGSDVSGFELELWGQQPDIFSVEIISPAGERVSRILAGYRYSRDIDFILENTVIHYYHKLIETISSQQVISLRFDKPSAGIWKIKVYNDNGLLGAYNMWLPINDFLDGEVYFLNSSPQTTLLMPSAGDITITVGAYDYSNNSIWADTGRGNAANGVIKPDIAAPGVNIYGPMPGGGHNLYTRRSGSSIAAAHAAGAAALLLEWHTRNSRYSVFNTSDIKALLKIGAIRDKNLTYPNTQWGYGRMDLINTFLVLSGQ